MKLSQNVTEQEQQARAARQGYMQNEVAYQQIQGTKPQSLGYGLNDSPAGLAAWIVEKSAGTLTILEKAALHIGVSAMYLCEVLNGKKEVGPKLQKFLGVTRHTENKTWYTIP